VRCDTRTARGASTGNCGVIRQLKRFDPIEYLRGHIACQRTFMHSTYEIESVLIVPPGSFAVAKASWAIRPAAFAAASRPSPGTYRDPTYTPSRD